MTFRQSSIIAFLLLFSSIAQTSVMPWWSALGSHGIGSLDRRLSTIRAAAAGHGLYDLYLFAVLFDQAAEVDVPVQAGVRVVLLVLVVVAVGLRYSGGVHSALPFCGPGSGLWRNRRAISVTPSLSQDTALKSSCGEPKVQICPCLCYPAAEASGYENGGWLEARRGHSTRDARAAGADTRDGRAAGRHIQEHGNERRARSRHPTDHGTKDRRSPGRGDRRPPGGVRLPKKSSSAALTA